jgi:hypothetical protein
MCPRSVALPRFSRTTHTAWEAKRSNFSYSELLYDWSSTASRYTIHHHRCRASTTLPSRYSLTILHHGVDPDNPNIYPRYVVTQPNCQARPKQIASAVNRFSTPKATYIFSEPRADFPYPALQEIRRDPSTSATTASRKPLLFASSKARLVPRNRCAHDGTAV